MLGGTIVLWALNLTVTRYVLTHGFQPLAYATVRYGGAALVFLGLTLAFERSLRVLRSDVPLVVAAALTLFLNQIVFVYALKNASASVIALILGATPIFAALLGLVLRTERLSGRFWLGAVVSFAGVGLVAAGHERRGLGGSRRDPARRRDGGHVGGVLGRDRSADAALLALPDLRARPRARLGRDRGRRGGPDSRPAARPRLGDLGAARVRDARAARPHEHPLVPLDPPDRPFAGDARREPAAVRRGSRGARCCSRSR